jgi:hemolysin activation/secretion protein
MLCLLSFAARGEEQQLPRFDVWEFAVEGNTVLSIPAVERAVYPYLGERRTIRDVEAAQAALQKAYREAGYQTVQVEIPEQKVEDGVVRLRVVEGRLEQVRVVGARYYSQGRILAQVPSLQPGGVPRLNEVQKELGQLSAGDNLRVLPVLRPGARFGTTEVDLNVQDKLPLTAGLEINNYYSPNTTQLRALANVRYDNLWQLQHSAGLQYQISPQDPSEVKVFSASYFAPVYGDYVGGYYVKSDSNVAAVGDLTVLGKGQILGLRWIKPLKASGSYTQSLTLGVDYKDFDENVNQPGTSGIATPVKYLPLMASYSGSLTGKRGVTSFSTGVELGTRVTFNNDDEFSNKRFDAQSDFFIFKWDVQRTQNLSNLLTLVGRFDGQVADQPLINNEQYAAGGANNVRGYLEAEALGDNAVHGGVEVRVTPASAKSWARLDYFDIHVFAEGAYLTIREPLPSQPSSSYLVSAGVGLRARALLALAVEFDVGVPLKSTSYTSAGDPRVQFSASYQY